MKLIADSGSTKTAWCIVGNSPHTLHTQGINPFQLSEEDICAILRRELLPQLQPILSQRTGIQGENPSVPHGKAAGEEDLEVFFYGAGCTPEKAPVVASALRQTIGPQAHIDVQSDMLGAARGLCGRQSGIVAILGTGSNACHYDGETLHAGNPALGYILGDEGSGAYIGKRLVGDILKHQLPDDLCQRFFEETHETQASILQKVYREPLPNRFLASLSPFCLKHRQHTAIQSLLIDCFKQFFQRNILTAAWDTDERTVHFVGSIAHHYAEELTTAATQCGCQVGRIMQSPLEGLITYHQAPSPEQALKETYKTMNDRPTRP